MRLMIAAVGRLKQGAEADLVADYAARIRALGRPLGFADFVISEVDAPRGLAGAARQTREGALLRAAAPDGARRVILDETGRDLPSAAFAKLLADWRDSGAPCVAFFIGGADGHAESVKKEADLAIAYGRATWPHLLVRAMLCEQIYRTMTILSGHPYHRA